MSARYPPMRPNDYCLLEAAARCIKRAFRCCRRNFISSASADLLLGEHSDAGMPVASVFKVGAVSNNRAGIPPSAWRQFGLTVVGGAAMKPPVRTRRLTQLWGRDQKCENPTKGDSAPKKAVARNSVSLAVHSHYVDIIKKATKELCAKENLDDPERRATRASIMALRAALGDKYEPSVEAPTVAERLWDDRDCSTPEGKDPIRFLDRYWGPFLDEGVLDQCTFRKLDPRLFEAIKWQCQRDGLKLSAYLPPPARQHRKSECDSAGGEVALREGCGADQQHRPSKRSAAVRKPAVHRAPRSERRNQQRAASPGVATLG